MTDNDRITDPTAIRAWFEQDWAEQYQPAPGYLDPVRAVEAEKRAADAEARLELAEARVDQLTELLTLRTEALNRTGESNDQLRATIARVAAVAGNPSCCGLPEWCSNDECAEQHAKDES